MQAEARVQNREIFIYFLCEFIREILMGFNQQLSVYKKRNH